MEIMHKIDDIARIIGVAAPTVKKYYLLFERFGYRFKRSAQGQVIFSDFEINLFRKFIQLKNEKGVTVEMAAKAILREYGTTVTTDTTDVTDEYDEDFVTDTTDIAVITERMRSLEEFLMQQSKLLEAQQYQLNRVLHLQQESEKKAEETAKILESKIQENAELLSNQISDRDKMFLTAVREMQDVKKMVAAAQEKKWWQIFKK